MIRVRCSLRPRPQQLLEVPLDQGMNCRLLSRSGYHSEGASLRWSCVLKVPLLLERVARFVSREPL